MDDVLYIAGLESSETPPAMSPTDINECCQECIQKVSQSSSRAVSIRFVPAREKFHLHTSCMLISKAITEMLRNAVHFAADGEITLAYTLDGGNRRITFTVTDSGPGIPACEAEHIFGRFVKLDALLARARARADRVPADRLGPGRHDKTRHKLQRRGTFRTFDTVTLNTKNQYNRPHTGKLMWIINL